MKMSAIIVFSVWLVLLSALLVLVTHTQYEHLTSQAVHRACKCPCQPQHVEIEL